MFSESETGEDGHVPLEKIMECVKSCIQVAAIDDILRQKADLIHVLLISLSPGFLWNGTGFFSFFIFHETFCCLYQSDFPWAVKMSGISCVGKLCSRFQSIWNDSMDGLLPSDATKFAHEVTNNIFIVYHTRV